LNSKLLARFSGSYELVLTIAFLLKIFFLSFSLLKRFANMIQGTTVEQCCLAKDGACRPSCRTGVGNVFCAADQFETEIFSRTGLQKTTNVQQWIFITTRV